MTTFDTAEQGLGLRERKNLRTRRAIVRATSELTVQGGYAAATIPKIAERADVAPRTVSTWFPSKDDIVFEKAEERVGRGVRHLRSGSGDVVERLEAWLVEERTEHVAPDPEIARLRRTAIEHDPELRARDRQYFETLQSELALALGEQLGVPADDMGPQIFAGAAMAFLWRLGSIALRDDPQDVEALVADGFRLLRATLAAVSADPA